MRISDLMGNDPLSDLARRSMLEHASGDWLRAVAVVHGVDAIAIEKALAALRKGPERAPVRDAVEAGVAAARALEPKPRNRHERRKAAALRRRNT